MNLLTGYKPKEYQYYKAQKNGLQKLMLQRLENKYFDDFNFYFSKPINEIISEGHASHALLYRDYLYFDNQSESMRRWYTQEESDIRLTNYTAFYAEINKQYYANLCIVEQRKVMSKRQYLIAKLRREQQDRLNQYERQEFGPGTENILGSLDRQSYYLIDFRDGDNQSVLDGREVLRSVRQDQEEDISYQTSVHDIYYPVFTDSEPERSTLGKQSLSDIILMSNPASLPGFGDENLEESVCSGGDDFGRESKKNEGERRNSKQRSSKWSSLSGISKIERMLVSDVKSSNKSSEKKPFKKVSKIEIMPKDDLGELSGRLGDEKISQKHKRRQRGKNTRNSGFLKNSKNSSRNEITITNGCLEVQSGSMRPIKAERTAEKVHKKSGSINKQTEELTIACHNFYNKKFSESSETRDKRSSNIIKRDSQGGSITNFGGLALSKEPRNALLLQNDDLIKNIKSPSINISDLLTKSQGIQRTPSEVLMANKKKLRLELKAAVANNLHKNSSKARAVLTNNNFGIRENQFSEKNGHFSIVHGGSGRGRVTRKLIQQDGSGSVESLPRGSVAKPKIGKKQKGSIKAKIPRLELQNLRKYSDTSENIQHIKSSSRVKKSKHGIKSSKNSHRPKSKIEKSTKRYPKQQAFPMNKKEYYAKVGKSKIKTDRKLKKDSHRQAKGSKNTESNTCRASIKPNESLNSYIRSILNKQNLHKNSMKGSNSNHLFTLKTKQQQFEAFKGLDRSWRDKSGSMINLLKHRSKFLKSTSKRLNSIKKKFDKLDYNTTGFALQPSTRVKGSKTSRIMRRLRESYNSSHSRRNQGERKIHSNSKNKAAMTPKTKLRQKNHKKVKSSFAEVASSKYLNFCQSSYNHFGKKKGMSKRGSKTSESAHRPESSKTPKPENRAERSTARPARGLG